jgi:hypothetical protein
MQYFALQAFEFLPIKLKLPTISASMGFIDRHSFLAYRFSLLVIISELQPVVFLLPSVLSTCAKLQQNTDTTLICTAVFGKT